MSDSGGAPPEVEDLTETEPLVAATPLDPVGLGGSTTLSDWTRVGLAAGLLALLAVVTLGSGWVVANDPDKATAMESFLKLVFTPLVGLVGSVVGFYFGSRAGTGGSER